MDSILSKIRDTSFYGAISAFHMQRNRTLVGLFPLLQVSTYARLQFFMLILLQNWDLNLKGLMPMPIFFTPTFPLERKSLNKSSTFYLQWVFLWTLQAKIMALMTFPQLSLSLSLHHFVRIRFLQDNKKVGSQAMVIFNVASLVLHTTFFELVTTSHAKNPPPLGLGALVFNFVTYYLETYWRTIS